MDVNSSVSPTEADRLADELLSLIELREAELLNWGFVDPRTELPGYSEFEQQIPEHLYPLWRKAGSPDATMDRLIDNLLERKLLFESSGYYRSRFAESIRLLALLRQRFSHRDWNSAPRLVTDIKTSLARRRYPRRDVELDRVIKELAQDRVNQFRLDAVRALLQNPEGENVTLAVFQHDAIKQIFRNLRQGRDRGLAVGAGTGAGKTKAFYVPALAEIAASLSNENRTQAVAIYPRIELLKDQFHEAFSEARKLDTLLGESGKRAITIGSYYGDTPHQASSLLNSKDNYWEFKPAYGGWQCPFLRCPNPACSSPNLIWRRDFVEREVEANKRGDQGSFAVLNCPTCRYETKPGTLVLTRDHLADCPPDILFTTTEMLNRRLSRTIDYSLFGIGTRRPPRLLLLDEIHTYDGIAGAQVAYVLRRWRHARGIHSPSSLTIVGLSATLTNAEDFLAQLTGLPRGSVTYIQPRESELVHEGMEYNVVLKGDPVSGSSLLSTTVQTAMLMGRILDPLRIDASRGTYGKKIFGFTDKLDVINRWNHIERDAEGTRRLSQYREPESKLNDSERKLRLSTGQDWAIPRAIGHQLRSPLRVALVSSQYRGVRPDAELVIATSTLEVGYNDPDVGAVLQHKAPRSMASFLQRKGRAGRTRSMRPWTLVVTSAYGRDRWAFQHSEQLFDPTLPPISLPVDNYYVQKIQAGFSLVDWIVYKLHESGFHDVDGWILFSATKRTFPHDIQHQRRTAHDLLLGVLTGELEAELSSYLAKSLEIGDELVALHSILWDSPRSLMLEAIPTLVRQLETNWSRVEGSKTSQWKDFIATGPLPEFVTSSLFSDLNTPELALQIPHTVEKGEDVVNEQAVPLTLGMVEFAPGHVSKRYARPWDEKESHWLALPPAVELSRGRLALDQLSVVTDEVPLEEEIHNEVLRVFRPLAYRLDRVPDNILNTSNARLRWKSLARVPESSATATDLLLSPHSVWQHFIRRISSFTHRNQSWVNLTRAAVGVEVDLRFSGGAGYRDRLHFEESHEAAALGFSSHVDGLRFQLEGFNAEALMEDKRWDELYRHLGPQFFKHTLSQDERIQSAEVSVFEAGWLWQLELSMLVAVAVSRQCSLPEAAGEVSKDRARLAARTLDVIFQTVRLSDEGHEDEHARLHEKLLDRMGDTDVVAAIESAARVLWAPDHEKLKDWLEQTYVSTVGHVIFAALSRAIPEIEPDDLHLDIDGNSVWITELTAGGIGSIARMTDFMAQQPRLLEAQLRDVLTHCDRASIAAELSEVSASLGAEATEMHSAFASVRNAMSLDEQESSRRELIQALDKLGITGARELIVSINSKFLRPGSNVDTDDLISHAVLRWEEEEQRLGCDIDLRVFAVASPQLPELNTLITRVLQRIDPSTDATENQVFNLQQSLLWLNCHNGCPDCIEKWFQYAEHMVPSRALLSALCDTDLASIRYGSADWELEARAKLTRELAVTVTCASEDIDSCTNDLTSFLLVPIDTGFQMLYPSVDGVRRLRDWYIDLILADVIDQKRVLAG